MVHPRETSNMNVDSKINVGETKLFALFFSLLIVIFFDPIVFTLPALCISCIYFVWRSPFEGILLPVAIYPFMFLLRNQENDNILLITTPDFVLLMSVLTYAALRPIRFGLHSSSIVLLFVGIFSVIIGLFHAGNVDFLPVLIRQLFLPLLYAAV